MSISDILLPEMIKALAVVAPIIIAAIVIGLIFNFARDLLEAFLSTPIGKVLVIGAIVILAIKFW